MVSGHSGWLWGGGLGTAEWGTGSFFSQELDPSLSESIQAWGSELVQGKGKGPKDV